MATSRTTSTSSRANLSYAQPHQLFHNRSGRATEGPAASPTFEEVGPAAGAPFAVPRVSRGAAKGDWDNDGDLDLLVSNNNGPCELLRNDGGSHRHWLEVQLVGRRSNRDGIGAEVRVTWVTASPRPGPQWLQLLFREQGCPAPTSAWATARISTASRSRGRAA